MKRWFALFIVLGYVAFGLSPTTASDKSETNFDGAACHECWFINGEDHCVYTREDMRCKIWFRDGELRCSAMDCTCND